MSNVHYGWVGALQYLLDNGWQGGRPRSQLPCWIKTDYLFGRVGTLLIGYNRPLFWLAAFRKVPPPQQLSSSLVFILVLTLDASGWFKPESQSVCRENQTSGGNTHEDAINTCLLLLKWIKVSPLVPAFIFLCLVVFADNTWQHLRCSSLHYAFRESPVAYSLFLLRFMCWVENPSKRMVWFFSTSSTKTTFYCWSSSTVNDIFTQLSSTAHLHMKHWSNKVRPYEAKSTTLDV